MTTSHLKTKVQARINALAHPTPAFELQQHAFDTVGLDLDLTNIKSVLNAATANIATATDDEITALNTASVALGVTFNSKLASTPIRGTFKFDVLTPDDFTYQSMRFLRASKIDTVVENFDTTIWNKKYPVPVIGADYVYVPFTDSHNMYDAIVADNGNIFATSTNSGMRSTDNGESWMQGSIVGNSYLAKLTSGLIVQAYSGSGNGWVYTFNPVTSELSSGISTSVAAAINGILTDGTRILVWGGNGAFRYSDNTTNFTTVSGGLNGDLTNCVHSSAAYGNGKWVVMDATGASSNKTWTSINGSEFTVNLAVFDTSGDKFLVFDNFSGLFKCFEEYASTKWQMYTSADGVTWSDPVQTDYDEVVGPKFVKSHPTENLLFTGGISVANGHLKFSVDGGITWDKLPYCLGAPSTIVAITATNIFAINAVESLKLTFGYFAGIYGSLEPTNSYEKIQERMTFVRVS